MSPWQYCLALTFAVTLAHVIVLFFSRLELYPDEAQYWLWSRSLQFGYFSKPPMIAWLIRATTAVGGDGEAWVRLGAPLLHGVAALALFQAGRRLYNGAVGFWASAIYLAMPGVQISSLVVATDAPLLCTLSLALWAYAVLWSESNSRAGLWAALGLGAALGAAFLTKYAALYMVGGLILHAAISREARARWDWRTLGLAVAAGVLIALPNLIWNAQHHFQTVAHTAENADLGDHKGNGLLGERGPFGFLLSQFGVFGPVPFGVALWGGYLAVRRRATATDGLLVCVAAPALLVVFAVSIAARANANWAGAAYPACAVLASALLQRWRGRRWRGAGLALQAIVGVVVVVGAVAPGFADAVGAGNSFKRVRGWRAGADQIVASANGLNIAPGTAPLSAVAVDDRFLFNALSYYARKDGRPAAALPAPLRMWVRLARPTNQAEAESPLRLGEGRRVLGLSQSPDHRPAFEADFTQTTPLPDQRQRLDRRHERLTSPFVGEGFRPLPRGPVSDRSRSP